MAERQVTIGEESHKLSRPFVVLATQNPIDQEGTYPLPEAQMDRFMMKLNVDYPDFESEKLILDLKSDAPEKLETILNESDLTEIKEEIDKIYVDEKIKNLIIKIVHATRPGNREFNSSNEEVIISGASPRACIWLYKISKFVAFRDRRGFVSPDHLVSIIPKVSCS